MHFSQLFSSKAYFKACFEAWKILVAFFMSIPTSYYLMIIIILISLQAQNKWLTIKLKFLISKEVLYLTCTHNIMLQLIL